MPHTMRMSRCWPTPRARRVVQRACRSPMPTCCPRSAPLSPALAERIAAVLGQLPLERYGSTEAGLDVSNPYEGPRRVGTVGLPLPGIELAIVNGTGALVPSGSDGEIVLRGPQVF